jgi:protein SCO1/2
MSKILYGVGLALALAACQKTSDLNDLAAAPSASASAAPSLSRAALPAEVASAAPSADGDHDVLGMGDVVSGASIYALDVALTNHVGAKTKLDVFRGRPVLVSMFYSSCPSACPLLISNIKRIEAALDPAVRSELRVVLVSFDPKHDTPEALRGVIERHGVDASRWMLMTGKDDEIRDVAAVLGIKYRQADGSFNHSSVITLLDRDGVIKLRVDGMGESSATMVNRVAEVAKAAPRAL